MHPTKASGGKESFLTMETMENNVQAERYRALYEQGFVPIFVNDSFDAVQLAEASVAAGAKVIEITCRRPNVVDEIKRIRSALPDVLVAVGSVVDDGPMLDFQKSRQPKHPSIAELVDLDIHGLVSMMPISLETVARYADTHIFVPGVQTLTEAVAAVEAGAHFAKFFDLSLGGEQKRAGLMTCVAVHGLIPIFVTGGVTLEKIEPYVALRTALLGSGWDVLLGDRYEAMQKKADTAALTAALKAFLDAMAEARSGHLSLPTGGGVQEFLDAVPHYHPF